MAKELGETEPCHLTYVIYFDTNLNDRAFQIALEKKSKESPCQYRKAWVQSVGQEDPLEKEMATHSSISCMRRNPMDRIAWWARVQRVAKSQTQLNHEVRACTHTRIYTHTTYSLSICMSVDTYIASTSTTEHCTLQVKNSLLFFK